MSESLPPSPSPMTREPKEGEVVPRAQGVTTVAMETNKERFLDKGVEHSKAVSEQKDREPFKPKDVENKSMTTIMDAEAEAKEFDIDIMDLGPWVEDPEVMEKVDKVYRSVMGGRSITDIADDLQITNADVTRHMSRGISLMRVVFAHRMRDALTSALYQRETMIQRILDTIMLIENKDVLGSIHDLFKEIRLHMEAMEKMTNVHNPDAKTIGQIVAEPGSKQQINVYRGKPPPEVTE